MREGEIIAHFCIRACRRNIVNKACVIGDDAKEAPGNLRLQRIRVPLEYLRKMRRECGSGKQCSYSVLDTPIHPDYRTHPNRW